MASSNAKSIKIVQSPLLRNLSQSNKKIKFLTVNNLIYCFMPWTEYSLIFEVLKEL